MSSAAPGEAERPAAAPIAVVDVGSNSVRMLVARPRAGGYLEVVAEPRAVLRLAREVDAEGGLSPAARSRLLDVLEDFMALARRLGVAKVQAVGTAALRDAANVGELVEAIQARWGVELAVLDGEGEARAAALGALYGLPVRSGLVLDLGGGSLQLARFEERAISGTWSFPFGTLRLTDRFLSSDPPASAELEALRHHVRAELASAGVPRLAAGEELVGTGGTVRNLAAVGRRGHRYPITRVHGFTLPTRRLRHIMRRLAELTTEERRGVSGLNGDRAEIIVAGAATVAAAMERVRARSLLVSGQGLREGVAREALRAPPLEPHAVRRAAVDALARRFASWDEVRAARRARLAAALQSLLDAGADEEQRETLEHAALLLDVGSAVDVYRRERVAAEIVLRADLMGFSHIAVARLAGVIRVAHRPRMEASVLRPLLGPNDDDALQRAGAILALADQLELRFPPGAAAPPIALAGDELRITLPGRPRWVAGELAARIERVFGRTLAVEGTAP